MTTLSKPVYRKTRMSAAVLYPMARQIVVGLLPGDVIEFRESGRRSRWYLSVETAFRYAVKLQAAAAALERRKRKTKT